MSEACTPQPDWRQNPNLVECCENWRETLRGLVGDAPCDSSVRCAPLPKGHAGDKLRRRRRALGLTQHQFAAECGLSRSSVSGVERDIAAAGAAHAVEAALDHLEAQETST